MDVYQNGQLVRTMTPQRIFYKASQQASTKPDIDQGFKEDLYLVYEGQNDKGQPVIKAHVNPMVIWIWIGAWVILIGTGLALVEPAPAPVTVRVPKMIEHAVATGERRQPFKVPRGEGVPVGRRSVLRAGERDQRPAGGFDAAPLSGVVRPAARRIGGRAQRGAE